MEWIAALGILFSPKEWRAAQKRVHAREVMKIVEERRAWLLDAGKCAAGVHVNVYLDFPRGHQCARCGELV